MVVHYRKYSRWLVLLPLGVFYILVVYFSVHVCGCMQVSRFALLQTRYSGIDMWLLVIYIHIYIYLDIGEFMNINSSDFLHESYEYS